jgi:hypothetical protein
MVERPQWFVHATLPKEENREPSGLCTCRDDADPEGAGDQHGSGMVLVNARAPLRPPDQPVQHLAEHAIATDTDNAAGRSETRQGPQTQSAVLQLGASGVGPWQVSGNLALETFSRC